MAAVAAAAAALYYGIVRFRGTVWGLTPTRPRAVLTSLPRPADADPLCDMRGRHRYEDAHTGSLSATAILEALNAKAS